MCSGAAAAAGASSMQPQLCIPKTPKFMSKNRTRKVTAQSQAELEEIEIEEMKKWVKYILICYEKVSWVHFDLFVVIVPSVH